ncbi:MAG: glycosyltransferase family 2 protein [bacterium]
MKISIVTPSYNSAETILSCLDSVKTQTLSCEHWVIDGGSSDHTLDLIKDRNVKLVSEPDQGPYDAMNKGVEKASGDIVGILNADDFYRSSDVLAEVERAFNEQEIDACYADLCYVDYHRTDKIVRYWESGAYYADKFKWGWMPPHPTVFIKKELYQKYGGFNLDMGTAADYELMLRFCVKHKMKMYYIPRVFVHMRVGGISNNSFSSRFKANRSDKDAWSINQLKPYPWTFIAKPIRKLPQWIKRPKND